MYKDSHHEMTPKLLIQRIILVVLLSISAEALFWMIGLGMTSNIYLFWHGFFGFDWTAHSSVRIDIRRFLEFWHTGFGILIVHILFYSLVQLIFKIKIKYDLLAALVIAFITLLVAFKVDMTTPRGTILGDMGYSMAYSFLFAIIMFAIFNLLILLSDESTQIKEPIKILLSFGVSSLLGYFVSWLIWIILFHFFHG